MGIEIIAAAIIVPALPEGNVESKPPLIPPDYSSSDSVVPGLAEIHGTLLGSAVVEVFGVAAPSQMPAFIVTPAFTKDHPVHLSLIVPWGGEVDTEPLVAKPQTDKRQNE
jgi:hypothetical protein